jgi:zinc/manganese transport system permease protein
MAELLSYNFVWLAILFSLILAGIHAYLGFHIVSRGVIFVDLSLAQMAALGAVSATMFGVEHDSLLRHAIALGFTIVGAGIVSITRLRKDRIPQEAFIGILYAASAALTILLLAQQPGGMEELQHLLAGSILSVTPGEILVIAVVYAVIGAIHYRFRDRFFQITNDREAAERKGLRIRGWDFLFYSTFAIVVTTAVSVAGVLLVFSLLVIPPVIALFFANGQTRRLTLGWIVAIVGSTGGVLTSIRFDLPAGPSIITVLVAILLCVVGIHRFRRVTVRT